MIRIILTVYFVIIMRNHFVVQIILHIEAIVNSALLNVKALDYTELNLQVILCLKHLFLHQLTQNMTTDFSLI